MKKHYFSLLPILSALFLFTACEKEISKGVVIINHHHQVAGQEVVTGQFLYTCQAGYPFSVTRLQYYTSNYVLHREDGTDYRLDTAHYSELELGETHSITMADVPPGKYTALSFIFGLDEDTNVDGGLPNTLTNINMEWPLPGDQGYHYMKFEGKYKVPATGDEKPYKLHTGATGNNQNYIEITLPLSGLDIDGNTWDLSLKMDLNEWLQNPNTWDFEFWGPAIMANQDAQLVLKANGTTVFSVESLKIH
ncbi:MAG: MbnP family protein [Saprospiraceae bacterium]